MPVAGDPAPSLGPACACRGRGHCRQQQGGHGGGSPAGAAGAGCGGAGAHGSRWGAMQFEQEDLGMVGMNCMAFH